MAQERKKLRISTISSSKMIQSSWDGTYSKFNGKMSADFSNVGLRFFKTM